MNEIFDLFAKYMILRFSNQIFTTEDSVRYTFFISLLKSFCLKPEDIILEYPHPVITKAEIDTYIPNYFAKPTALEFKYHRRIPSGRNVDRTGFSGALFADIKRLRLVVETSGARAFFVYVCDDEMAGYLRNQRNGLRKFFLLPENKTLILDDEFFRGRAKTLRARAGEVQAQVKMQLNRSLGENHYVRIYEVFSLK